MRILVTGGAGFIGSMLIPELLKERHKVTVLDNLTWGIKGLSPDFGNPGFTFFRGDIRDERLVRHLLEGEDIVVHLAALVGCDLCESKKEEATDVNVNGSRIICSHLLENQLIIFASTGSVYGQANGSSCTEKTVTSPESHYAITKFEAEKIFAEREKVIVLRFATAFGVSLRTRFDLLVNQFVYEAIKQRKLLVYGGDYVRSIIHVRDIVRSILFAIHNREFMQGQTFNVSSSGSSFTKKQIAEHVRKQVDYDLQFDESYSDPDGRNYHLSTQKIEDLGYRANVSLDTGIIELVSAISSLEVDETFFNTMKSMQ